MNKRVLDYVKDYFETKFYNYRLVLKDNEYDELIYYISSIVNDKYRDNLELMDLGEANELINSNVMNYLRHKVPEFKANCINLKNYMKKYIFDKFFVNFSMKTLDYIIEMMLPKLIFSYNYNDLYNGKYDDKINLYYNDIVKSLSKEMTEYVVHYIALNISPLTDIDDKVVASYVVDLIVNNDKFNILSLFAGEYNKYIIELAEKNRRDNQSKRVAVMPDTYKYIRNKISSKTKNINLINKAVEEIDIELRNRGLNASEIVSGKYDVDINALYNEVYFRGLNFDMSNMSVESENVPNRIKKNGKKVSISKAVSSLLILSVLSGAALYGSYAIGKGIRKEYAKDNLSKLDSYSYSSIGSIYDHDFEPTVTNILNTYKDYSNYGDNNFNYLAFYRAFNSCSYGKSVKDDDRFYVMDNMLYKIKNLINTDSEYAELKSVLKVNGSYLDFIYERLYEMGYTEIRDDKYIELLQSYVKAKNEHPYKDPVESLNDSQVRLLNKVSKIYMELSEQYLIEFGVLLGNNNYSDVSTTGRGHSV